MEEIEKIIQLAAKLPSGLNDAKAADKLLSEREELLESLATPSSTWITWRIYSMWISPPCSPWPSTQLVLGLGQGARRMMPLNVRR